MGETGLLCLLAQDALMGAVIELALERLGLAGFGSIVSSSGVAWSAFEGAWDSGDVGAGGAQLAA